MVETAVILSEGFFGQDTAKTAAGLVRHSERFLILGVIDSVHAGKDAGIVLDGTARGIPVFANLDAALSGLDRKPDWLVIGVATVGGRLPDAFRPGILQALEHGMNVISGLHQRIADDNEFAAAAELGGGTILDIRQSPPLHSLHPFTDQVRLIGALRIPVMGTDSSIGKRTTAVELVKALNGSGIPATMVATGQTGLLQGARFGLPLDSIMGDYMVGELEHQILLAFESEHPSVIVIEGQGSLSHPAYVCGSRAVLSASRPSAVILQHAPARKVRNYGKDTLGLPMPSLEEEMKLIKAFSGADLIGITINDKGMAPGELEAVEADYEARFGVPAVNPLTQGCAKIVAGIEEMLHG